MQVDFRHISCRKPVMDAPSSIKLYRVKMPRSLDATKWNRGPLHRARDRVGGSLDGRRRLVMVDKSAPFCGNDCQKGIVGGFGVVCLAARVATLRLQPAPPELHLSLVFRGLLSWRMG